MCELFVSNQSGEGFFKKCLAGRVPDHKEDLVSMVAQGGLPPAREFGQRTAVVFSSPCSCDQSIL